MRKMRSLITLVVALVLLIGTYVYLRNRPQESDPDEQRSPAVEIVKLERDDIVRLSLKNVNGEIVFEKDEEGWEILKPYTVEILQHRVTDVSRTLSDLTAKDVVEEEPENLAPYGLETPSSTGEVVLNDGTIVILKLGNLTPTGDSYYLMREGDPRVYTIFKNHGDRLSYVLSDFRNKTLDMIDVQQDFQYFFKSWQGLKDIEIEMKDEQDEQLAQFGLGLFHMTKPYNKPMGVDFTPFGELLEVLPGLSIDDFIDDFPEDLSLYGLDEPSGRLTVKDEEKTLDLIFGDKLKVEEGDAERIYFQIAGSDIVYAMNLSRLAFMETKPFNLVEKFAFIVNIDHVDKVIIEGFDRTHTLSLTRRTIKAQEEDEEDEVITTYKLDDKEVEEKAFKRFYQTVIGLTVDAENFNMPDEDAAVKTTYYLNIGPDEDREIEIQYVPYDRDFYSVVRDGESEFLIGRRRITTLYDELDMLISGELSE